MDRLKNRKILIVEDEPDLREIIKFEFESEGATVFEAEGGIEAFEIVKSQSLDLVVSDARMPKGSGIELLKNIKARDANTPAVLLMTGFADFSSEEAYANGVSGLIYKPFDLDAFMRQVIRSLRDYHDAWSERPERKPSEFKAVISQSNMNEASARQIMNIGAGGMFVATNGPFPQVGELIKFSINFSDDVTPIEGTGIVRWCRTKEVEGKLTGYGVEFFGLSNIAITKISKILESLKNKVPFIPQS